MIEVFINNANYFLHNWKSACSPNKKICKNNDPASGLVSVFSGDRTLERLPFLVSNAVPSTSQQQQRWQQLIDMLLSWLGGGELNVVMGPVFDKNADSIVDDFSSFTLVKVKTSLYVIVWNNLKQFWNFAIYGIVAAIFDINQNYKWKE